MTRAQANRLLDRVKAGEVHASERTITLALCLTGDLPRPWTFDEHPVDLQIHHQPETETA